VAPLCRERIPRRRSDAEDSKDGARPLFWHQDCAVAATALGVYCCSFVLAHHGVGATREGGEAERK